MIEDSLDYENRFTKEGCIQMALGCILIGGMVNEPPPLSNVMEAMGVTFEEMELRAYQVDKGDLQEAFLYGLTGFYVTLLIEVDTDMVTEVITTMIGEEYGVLEELVRRVDQFMRDHLREKPDDFKETLSSVENILPEVIVGIQIDDIFKKNI